MRAFLSSLTFMTSVALLASNEGFIPNKGQIHDQHRKPNPAVKYLLNGAGMNVQLRADGFSYDTYVMEERERANERESEANGEWAMANGERRGELTSTKYHFHRIDLRFVNGNPNAEMITEGKSQDHLNYYTDVTGEAGAVFIHHYTSVTYKEVWPNIDVRCNATEAGFKYDVIVRPGGSPDDVRFHVEGATVSESLKGRLVFLWEDGTLEESIPDSWVENGRRKLRVDVRYSTNADGTFGFAIEYANGDGTLVIDPMPLIWCTFYGGSATEKSGGVGSDYAHNSYLAGSTTSSTAIATSGAHDNTYDASNDGFLVKFNDPGSRLWGTYFGGSGTEWTYGIDTNEDGLSAVVGSTGSTSGIATTGTHQTVHTGNEHDGFVITFNAAGQRIWGTYYGGTDGTGILHDAIVFGAISYDGAVGGTGWTTSQQGIATPGSDKPTGANCFVVHFTATGQRTWGSYVAATWAAGLTFAGSSRLIITGYGNSTTGVATNTPGRHDGTYNGSGDAFLIAYNTSNGTKAWGTYLGGAGSDYGTDVDFVALSRVVAVGYTNSTYGIATSGAHQTNFGGGEYDGYVVSFNTLNGARTWGTYAGEGQKDQIRSVNGTGTGFVCVAGTVSLNQQSTPGGTAFCAQYSTAGVRYMRPTLAENLQDVFIAATGNGMWVSATTTTATDVTPLYAHQPVYCGGTSDAVLYHLHLAAKPVGMMLSDEGHESTEVVRNTTIDKSLEIVPNMTGANEEGRMQATIIDAQGRMVERVEGPASASMRLDLSHRAPGAYGVIIYANGQTLQAERFIIP